MPKRSRRRSNRRPRRPRAYVALPLIRLSGVALALVLLVTLVPPVRAAASALGRTVSEAFAASRAADARRVAAARFAERYGVSRELAAAVQRAAEEEGIDPDLAFRLVAVESEFNERAVSSAGALGLTQLMPATAADLQPGITREEIFQRETNLRLGFRYLRVLLRVYDGRVDEALHAYNRGPGTVDRIRSAGGDPANGYARRVLRAGERPYQGDGLVD